ncbi:MAG TPA: GNAT family N-acetyltransferase [Rhizomicrobium sp.]|nr:GNAT family N-acetyltransferase [Rhizomicrobium sp.]
MCILESERLILRPPRPVDIASMAVWLGDYAVSKNLAKVPHPYGENDAEDFVASRGRHGGGHYCFTILKKSDGLFLGGIGLHQESGGYEMGYWLGRPFWGEGYATEAARRVAHFAFEELGELTIEVGWFHDNPASGHVLAKLGARHNGSRMRDCCARGVKVLCHEMLLTRADFLRKEAA